MWLSRRITHPEQETEAAALGTISMGGSGTAVVTDGEKRDVRIISPGGYCWQPGAGESVLVLKASQTYIPGALQTAQAELAPGEVMVFSNAARLVLRNNGDIEVKGRVRITGRLFVNGRELGAERWRICCAAAIMCRTGSAGSCGCAETKRSCSGRCTG